MSKLRETEEDREDWSAVVPGVTKNQTQSSLYKPFYKVSKQKLFINTFKNVKFIFRMQRKDQQNCHLGRGK